MFKRNPVKILVAAAVLASASPLALAMDEARDSYWHSQEPDGLARAAGEAKMQSPQAMTSTESRAPSMRSPMSGDARTAAPQDVQAREADPQARNAYDFLDKYIP